MSESDEGYIRNTLHTLNQISMFLVEEYKQKFEAAIPRMTDNTLTK